MTILKRQNKENYIETIRVEQRRDYRDLLNFTCPCVEMRQWINVKGR